MLTASDSHCRAGEPGRRATLEIRSPRAASAALVLPQLMSAACWEGGCFCFCHRERSAVMLSVYGAHGWALSWASAPARRRTVCRTMWPGSPGPWRGQVCCCPGAVYTRSSAARGPSTLAPLCEPRPAPSVQRPPPSPSLPPSRAEFGLPHTHPSAFFLP